ncbi:MAG: bifunctional diaminohydroxyphosphoribosylaminopyrimidine deaminase/5-amino-6-(5-phosphoribosylamino)uracil reductase RibD [Thermodesulfobacteriota bacterium]|nr:bifunctional diaminohydroxyphosphoribosylaminopyrimidine deaminase/5-amino-6-(5-phosphoribosylamino)uracil reductase RibD [Thermodesulfobacteriota bacterium]
MPDLKHHQFMQRALDLARQGEGRTAPNPPVGAVIVKAGEIVGEGFHPQAGEPHAEIFALRQAGRKGQGGDIYVTLEPCSHHGKTPPCAAALIAAGIKTVYVGVVDPNPQVAGKGIEMLQKAGIEVQIGILEPECRRLIKPFEKHLSTGLPFTIYKAAMTLDGNTATAMGDSRWVSGVESRRQVHRLRNRVEAIMVGVGTVVNDDPLLNTRIADGSGRDPLRVVVDSQLRISPDCRMLQQQSGGKTLIATISLEQTKIASLQNAGAEVVVFSADSGKVPLLALWEELGRRNVQRLLLEGGSKLAEAALNGGLIDQLMLFVAPKLLGGSSMFGIFSGSGCAKMSAAIKLTDVCYQQVGEDLLITGDIEPCLPD